MLGMIVYNIHITSATVLTFHMILLCTKTPVPTSGFSYPFHRKMYISLLLRCHLWVLCHHSMEHTQVAGRGEGSCKYTEYEVMGSQQGAIIQLWG
jgi:hypothetical protein